MSYEANVNALAGATLEGADATPGGKDAPMKAAFEVVDVIPQGKGLEVAVMRDRRPDAHMPWCAQYRGAGHYFSTLGELDTYCRGRGFKGWR